MNTSTKYLTSIAENVWSRLDKCFSNKNRNTCSKIKIQTYQDMSSHCTQHIRLVLPNPVQNRLLHHIQGQGLCNFVSAPSMHHHKLLCIYSSQTSQCNHQVLNDVFKRGSPILVDFFYQYLSASYLGKST